MIKSLFKKNKKVSETRDIPRTTQESIPILKKPQDGIFQIRSNEYSKTILLEDIDYHTSRQDFQENLFMKYCNFINSFDDRIFYQIHIINSEIELDTLKNKLFMSEKEDEINLYRKEYNEIIEEKILKGRNDIETSKYLTITTISKSFEEAKIILERTEKEIVKNFKAMGVNSKPLTSKERLLILYKFYREENEEIFNSRYVEELSLNDIKNLIAPSSFKFNNNNVEIQDKFSQTIFIDNLPTFLSDTLIRDLTDFSINMSLAINITPYNPEKAINLINKQLNTMESNKINYTKRSYKNGYFDAFIPSELAMSLEEGQELLKDVRQNNQKLFSTSIVITFKADSQEKLKEYYELYRTVVNRYICTARVLTYQQEESLITTLPYGLNNLQLGRTLTTETTAVFVPFNSQDLIDSEGRYMGLNSINNKIIAIHRKKTMNSNGFILGQSGSGKSFAAKFQIADIILNSKDDVLIIDPEREYFLETKAFGGEVIQIGTNSQHHINPLDMSKDYADEDNPITLKSDFILSLCELAVGGKEGINTITKSILDRCVRIVYREYINNNYDEKYLPTLVDFHKVLQMQEEKEAKEVSVALEMYILGNQNVFSHRTNIDINNRFICFDIKDLGDQLKTLGMLVVLDTIWNRITNNRKKGIRTWIFIDEIYLLFANKYSLQFLFELYKRARKWGAIPTGITQDIDDLVLNEKGKAMLTNSEFVQILSQGKLSSDVLSELYNLSEEQIGYITNAPTGTGIIKHGESIIPFYNDISEDTKLYELLTTKFEEMV